MSGTIDDEFYSASIDTTYYNGSQWTSSNTNLDPYYLFDMNFLCNDKHSESIEFDNQPFDHMDMFKDFAIDQKPTATELNEHLNNYPVQYQENCNDQMQPPLQLPPLQMYQPIQQPILPPPTDLNEHLNYPEQYQENCNDQMQPPLQQSPFQMYQQIHQPILPPTTSLPDTNYKKIQKSHKRPASTDNSPKKFITLQEAAHIKFDKVKLERSNGLSIYYFKCSLCPYKTNTSQSMKDHLYCIHCKAKHNYKCNICLQTFGWKNNAQRHMRRKHQIGDQTKKREAIITLI